MNTTGMSDAEYSKSPDHSEQEIVLLRAVEGTEAWRTAIRMQRHLPAEHGAVYNLAGELACIVGALEDLTRVLGPQVTGYAESERAAGRVVYDDSRTVDPADRLAEAVAALDGARVALGTAERAINVFWSAIGHIGTTEQPR